MIIHNMIEKQEQFEKFRQEQEYKFEKLRVILKHNIQIWS